MNQFAYIRVSSGEQNEDRQRFAMLEFGVPKKILFWINSPAKTLTAPGTKNC